jgi:hypothetical protein
MKNTWMDDTGIEPGTSRMLSACDNQLHQTPLEFSCNGSVMGQSSRYP